jgi:hypothetical protein
VRFLALPDMNGNGVPELAVFGPDENDAARGEVRDSRSGERLALVTFSSALAPIDFAIVPGYGLSPAVAMLGHHPIRNFVVVITKDLATDAKISTTGFNPLYYPLQLLALPNVDANGEPEFAVLGAGGSVKVEVRNRLGGLLRNVWMGSPNHLTAQIGTIDDVDGDGYADLVTFQKEHGWQFAKVRNLRSGALIRTEGFNPNLEPIKFVTAPDLDENGVSELALLGRIIHQNAYRTKVEIRDPLSDRVANVWFDPAYSPEDLVTLPDVSGNGVPELAMLGIRREDALIQVLVRDANTGAFVNAIPFVKAPLKARAISKGHHEACAIRFDGSLACWETTSPSPEGAFAQVDVGQFACGVRTNGNLDCWGGFWSDTYQLPSGPFIEAAVGERHACGIRTRGTIACWAVPGYGTLEPPAGTFIDVAVYGNACGVRTDGRLACWSPSGYTNYPPPAGRFTQVADARWFMCGLRTNGEVACWGVDYLLPTDTPAGPFTQISAGSQYVCGLRSDKTIACWGSSSDGATDPPAGEFTQISAGEYGACAIRTDDTIACWGAAQMPPADW